jgi:pimeloyl-ACP methyl ester carboxylesterase
MKRKTKAVRPARRPATTARKTTPKAQAKTQPPTTKPSTKRSQQLAPDAEWYGFSEAERDYVLANEARTKTRGPERPSRGVVIVVPGILASPIGRGSDTVWLDWTEIPRGGLRKLRLPEGNALHAEPFTRGPFAILYSFYRTTMSALEAEGYEARLYPYDWRRDIGALGMQFGAWLRQYYGDREVTLVAHSMGGLVCRAAFGHLGTGGARITRFITAGTPLRGAASPLLVMRQLHGLALKISGFDPSHDASEVADIFCTMPGLLGMMPHFQDESLFRLDRWPRDAFHPPSMTQANLTLGRNGMRAMRRPPSGCATYVILGDGLNTIARINQTTGGIEYVVDARGDGTVPHASGLPTPAEGSELYYLHNQTVRGLGGSDSVDQAEHGNMFKRSVLAEAILSLMENGTCNLARQPGTMGGTRTWTEAELRQRDGSIRQKPVPVRTPAMQTEFWHRVLSLTPLLEDPQTAASLPQAGASLATFPFPRAQMVRGDKVRLELELALGDITEVSSRVVLLGQFHGMDPSEAASSIDDVMDGALMKLIRQRNATHGAGDMDLIPTGRHPLMAELIGFLGLGNRDQFSGEVLAAAAESGTRMLLMANFDEFATVLMGGRMHDTTQVAVDFAIRHMLSGVVQALRDAPSSSRFRRIVIVERQEQRMRQIHKALSSLLWEDAAFDGCTLVLSSERLPQRRRTAVTRGEGAGGARVRSNQILINFAPTPSPQERSFNQSITFIPATGSGASVKEFKGGIVMAEEIEALYSSAGIGGQNPQGVLSSAVLETVVTEVNRFFNAGYQGQADSPAALMPLLEKSRPLEIIHNSEASRLPWECLRTPDGAYPALQGGISRRYASDRARVLWSRPNAARPRILMVINPTGDLNGAAREGQQLHQFLRTENLADVTYLEGDQATESEFERLMNSGEFDILHYAGHSAFSRENASHSGLVLAGHSYFTGADAQRLAHFPAIVVFNSCQAARIRRLDPVILRRQELSKPLRKHLDLRDSAHASVSVAESFLIAGVQHFIGTFWPVQDASATEFAIKLYSHLGKEKSSMGGAILEARRHLNQRNLPDWANYIHYGDPQDVPFVSSAVP